MLQRWCHRRGALLPLPTPIFVPGARIGFARPRVLDLDLDLDLDPVSASFAAAAPAATVRPGPPPIRPGLERWRQHDPTLAEESQRIDRRCPPIPIQSLKIRGPVGVGGGGARSREHGIDAIWLPTSGSSEFGRICPCPWWPPFCAQFDVLLTSAAAVAGLPILLLRRLCFGYRGLRLQCPCSGWHVWNGRPLLQRPVRRHSHGQAGKTRQ